VCTEFSDVVIAYGESDEYSFVLRNTTALFKRRASKISTSFVSYFTSCYVMHWNEFFPEVKLQCPPSFDGRVVMYPTVENLRDYLSWRQADCHINNLYNTVFWALVLRGKATNLEAVARLQNTLSAEKNEILFTQFGINYNKEPDVFRKGSVVFRKEITETVFDTFNKTDVARTRRSLVVVHDDIIGDEFWRANPHLLQQEDRAVHRM